MKIFKYVAVLLWIQLSFNSSKAYANNTVLVTSTPKHVTLCEKIRRDILCTNKFTPFPYPVNATTTKKLILKKVGYKSKAIFIDSSKKNIHVKLKKTRILDLINGENNNETSALVYKTLNKFLYNSNHSLEKNNIDLVGRINVLVVGGKSHAFIELKPYGNQLNKSLKKISRIRNSKEQHTNLIGFFLKNGGAKFISTVTDSLAKIKNLDNISYIFHFTNKAFKLGEKFELKNESIVTQTHIITKTWYERELTTDAIRKNRKLIVTLSINRFHQLITKEPIERIIESSSFLSNANHNSELKKIHYD